ncbi:hypothetical protein COL516b_008023 [Colletotrichum fioriniae]|nr:uncharacterized protein COL516b_008023 [Colletotrichum fioriniae]KAJ0301246.1 hypothetical protein COL516b_008023 [Colletotrichum fioriniae]
MLIQRQTERAPYDSVSVLLLRWEEDTSVEADLTALENILRDRYNYQTNRWAIPTVPNPSIKLGVQMASFLEHARPNHLLIIYYAGYAYVGSDNQLYWACNTREDAAKLKWDGVRCLFEDAQSDILLLLDACSVRDIPVSGSHGTKQAIAAGGPEQNPREAAGKSFTYHLIEALHKLSIAGRPFSVPRLHEEIVQLRQQETAQAAKLTNGASKTPPPSSPQLPICFTLTPGKGQSLSLAPLPARAGQQQSPRNGADGESLSRAVREDQLIDPESVADLRFDEPRVLVCTTFVGDASPDMSFFNGWLHNTPPLAAKIEVEGMFLGPPTMLLISMPHSIWNVVQHDKVCCFLGYITSHNMIHLYQKLKGSAGIPKVTAKEVEDGRILLEARELAASTPSMRQRSLDSKDASFHETANRIETTPSSVPFAAAAAASAVVDGKDDVEDSAEMQEAAEQLKALSHVRHLSDEAPPAVERQLEGKGNEFNRKDLFTQHLRRMHAPFAIKKAIAKGDSKLQVEWEGHVKEMQTTCLVTRRSPPQRSACPKSDCQVVFEGPGSWDEWTEHVGRHMEKGEGQRLGVDRLLAKWAFEEGIIERKDDGEYRLCAGNGPGTGGGPIGGDSKDSISVAYPEPKLDVEETTETKDTAEDKMEVDG